MRATINKNEELVLIPEDDLEWFAVIRWAKENQEHSKGIVIGRDE